MKKTIAILLILATVLCLCACGKTAITAEEFASRMRNLGMNLEDYEGEKGYFGYPEDKDCLVMFLELDDANVARGAYERFKDRSVGESGSSTETSTSHSAFYSKKTATEVYMAAYIDNTFMYGEASAEDGEILATIFKTMGYK